MVMVVQLALTAARSLKLVSVQEMRFSIAVGAAITAANCATAVTMAVKRMAVDLLKRGWKLFL